MKGDLIEIKKFFFKTMSNIRNNLFLDFFKEKRSACEMNKNQYKTILILKHHGHKSMTELCGMLQIEKGSCTTIIDILTEKGYTMRTRDEKDRRKYVIKLTEKGIEYADEQINKLDQHLMKKINKLSEAEINEFVEAIKTLEKIAKKL